jgi:hypothetical protein
MSLEQAQNSVGTITPTGNFLQQLLARINGALNRVAAAFDQAGFVRPADTVTPNDTNPIPFFHAERQVKVIQVVVTPSAASGPAPNYVELTFYVLSALGVPGPVLTTVSSDPIAFVAGAPRIAVLFTPAVIPAGGSLAYKAKGFGTGVLAPTAISAQILAA